MGPQGQPAWNRQLTGIFLLDASGSDNGQAALTGFKGDDVYFNTIDTNGILQQSSVYALTNFTGQQDVGQAVRWAGGFYCLAGTFRTPGSAGTEAFFMCLNSSHNIAWAYKMEGPQSEVFSDLRLVVNGGGFSLLANTDSDGTGGTDVLLLRTANDGSLQGTSLFGGGGEDRGWAGYACAEGPGSKMGHLILSGTLQVDRVGKKAYFTSTLFQRKAGAFPLGEPNTGAGWFSPTEMSARAGSRAWRSEEGRRHSFELYTIKTK